MADKNKDISLRRLIANDKSLIVVALLLAVLIWIITSLNIGTDETKTVNIEVPISLSDEFSQQMGMQYYSLQDTVELSVTVSGAKYVVGQVSEDDLAVKFDTSNVNRAGSQSIPILVTNKSKTLDFNVTGTYPSSIDAYFDVDASKTMDLYLIYDTDMVADGMQFGTPVMSEDKVIVSGPKTYVDKIEQLQVNVDLGNEPLTESYNADASIDIVGLGAEASYIRMTSRTDTSTELKAVHVTLPVLNVMELPVSVEFDEMPSALPQNALDIKYSIRQLRVGVLASANVNSVVVGKIPFSQLYPGKNVFNFKPSDAQGVSILDTSVTNIEVEITVPDDYKRVTIPVSTAAVKTENVPAGNTATVKSLDFANVWVIAPSGYTPTANDITLTCDLSGATESGTYPVEITVNNNGSWIYGAYNAAVELTPAG